MRDTVSKDNKACCANGRDPITKEDFRKKRDQQKEAQFKCELAHLINKYNMENGSDTPDFILAEYLFGCIKGFSYITRCRDNWYGDRG